MPIYDELMNRAGSLSDVLMKNKVIEAQKEKQDSGIQQQILERKKIIEAPRQAAKINDKLTKVLSPYSEMANMGVRFHQAASLGTEAGDKDATILWARASEGLKNRLFASVVNRFGGDPNSVPAHITDAFNKLSGGAESKLTPEQRKAILDAGRVMYDDLDREYELEKQKLSATLPSEATFIDNADELMQSHFNMHETNLKRYKDERNKVNVNHKSPGISSVIKTAKKNIGNVVGGGESQPNDQLTPLITGKQPVNNTQPTGNPIQDIFKKEQQRRIEQKLKEQQGQ